MIEFIDDVISYLDSKFNSATSLSKKPVGHLAYEKGLEPDAVTPFYTIQIIDNSTSSEDFEKETVESCPIQINVYGVKMKVNNVIKDSQTVSLILADLCKSYMEEFKYSSSKIVSMRRMMISPALPYEDGSKSYYSVLRYNINLKVPYAMA